MEKFNKREWVATDKHPGASDLNRIENGIESAHTRIDEIKKIEIERLDDSAKVVDCAAKINEIIDALSK